MKLKIEYLVFVLFVIAAVFYVNLDKVPLTHPGNLKAADAFYHSMMVEGILNSKQWNYFDYPVSLGEEKAVNVQPPLFYIVSAILTHFSGVPAWASLYFLICISQAFFLILIYLITNEIFDNKHISFLAASMVVLPMTVRAWLYDLFIGIWLQVAGFLFVLLYFWMYLRYLKHRERWSLFFLGMAISSNILLHPMDLLVLIIPTGLLGLIMIRDLIKEKKIDAFIRDVIAASALPLLAIIVMLPRILFQWGSQGRGLANFGFSAANMSYFTRSYLGGLVYPDIMFIPLILLILYAIGFFQILLNYKKYYVWIITSLYYFFLTYATPLFIKDPAYYTRMRAFTPYFVFPVVAYIIYYVINSLKPHIKNYNKLSKLIFYIMLPIIFIAAAIPQYNEVVNDLKPEHISIQEWNAYRWIQENTDPEANVLFFSYSFQNERLYTKRKAASMSIDEVQKMVSEVIQTNITPETFNGGYAASTLRASKRKEISFFKFEKYDEPDLNMSIKDFDIIVFQDINEQIANVNRFFAYRYITEFGFKPVYDAEGYLILKNENI